jgi:hypothetical protein
MSDIIQEWIMLTFTRRFLQSWHARDFPATPTIVTALTVYNRRYNILCLIATDEPQYRRDGDESVYLYRLCGVLVDDSQFLKLTGCGLAR